MDEFIEYVMRAFANAALGTCGNEEPHDTHTWAHGDHEHECGGVMTPIDPDETIVIVMVVESEEEGPADYTV